MMSENMIRFQEAMKKWRSAIKEHNDFEEDLFKDDVDLFYERLTKKEKKQLILESSSEEKENC